MTFTPERKNELLTERVEFWQKGYHAWLKRLLSEGFGPFARLKPAERLQQYELATPVEDRDFVLQPVVPLRDYWDYLVSVTYYLEWQALSQASLMAQMPAAPMPPQAFWPVIMGPPEGSRLPLYVTEFYQRDFRALLNTQARRELARGEL